MQAVQGRASFGLLHVDAAGMAAASMLMRELVSSGYLSCTLGAVQCQASLGLQHVDAKRSMDLYDRGEHYVSQHLSEHRRAMGSRQ